MTTVTTRLPTRKRHFCYHVAINLGEPSAYAVQWTTRNIPLTVPLPRRLNSPPQQASDKVPQPSFRLPVTAATVSPGADSAGGESSLDKILFAPTRICSL